MAEAESPACRSTWQNLQHGQSQNQVSKRQVFASFLKTKKYRIRAMQATKQVASKISRQEAAAISKNEAALWGRLLDPVGVELSAEAARYILTMTFPQPDIERMQELAEKARAGMLTLDEHIELDNYERVGHVLSLMKSKARQALKKARAAH